MKKFCDKCLKDVEVVYKEENTKEFIDDVEIEYLEKYYVCKECNHEFYDDLHDYNIDAANYEYRKAIGMITIPEIEEIIEKYNIGKKPLSLILGLGEITITRYLDGQNPTKENSELLKNIKDNPCLYELYLLGNKDKITEVAFKKSLGKTKQLQMNEEHSKLYDSALYIVKKLEDTTPLALQKILYFAQCFSNKFMNKILFVMPAEAWIHGPVYRDIYDCFSYYKNNAINYSELLSEHEFSLDTEEKEYLDSIIKYFGCYSARVLREMTHLTKPWQMARKGLNKDESSNRIIELKDVDYYVDEVSKKYNINKIDDLKQYSTDLFEMALSNLESR